MLKQKQTSPERGAGSEAAYTVALCRGKGACPFGLVALEPLGAAIETAIAGSPWQASAGRADRRRIRPHDRLRIALSACPNGCSQPQIHDIGLIAALRPRDVTTGCTGCGLCEKICREAAVFAQDGQAVLRPAACLACGECARACPASAIRCEPLGFRLLLGGRLGRHPALATELAGLYAPERIPGVIRSLLRLLLREARAGERPGQTLARLAVGQIEHELGESYDE